MIFRLAIATIVAFLATVPAQATSIRYDLSNVNFAGGGSAIGSFVYDPTLHQLISANLTTTAGGVLGGQSYFFDAPTPSRDNILFFVPVSTGVTQFVTPTLAGC